MWISCNFYFYHQNCHFYFLHKNHFYTKINIFVFLHFRFKPFLHKKLFFYTKAVFKRIPSYTPKTLFYLCESSSELEEEDELEDELEEDFLARRGGVLRLSFRTSSELSRRFRPSRSRLLSRDRPLERERGLFEM